MPIKTLCVFGTRPEAIKMAPVINALKATTTIQNKICVTGQHEELLNSVLQLFCIVPDINLQVMTKNQNLSTLTMRLLKGLNQVCLNEKPDLMLVQGDTTTTFAAALSAYYHHIPVAHIEAGLRTNNIYSPWPEEGNRKLTTVLTSLHFAPTETSRINLLNEGVCSDLIHVTGNTVVDALMSISHKMDTTPSLIENFRDRLPILKTIQRFILVTGHRRENFGEGFKRVCTAILETARLFPDIDIVYPVHLNPNVQKIVMRRLSGINNIHLIPPVDYLAFIFLMRAALFILTDSGGIQEEAPSLGKPVLLMREFSERVEAIEAGSVMLVGTDVEKIVTQIKRLITNKDHYLAMSHARNPYGDGKASERIVKIISAWK